MARFSDKDEFIASFRTSRHFGPQALLAKLTMVQVTYQFNSQQQQWLFKIRGRQKTVQQALEDIGNFVIGGLTINKISSARLPRQKH